MLTEYATFPMKWISCATLMAGVLLAAPLPSSQAIANPTRQEEAATEGMATGATTGGDGSEIQLDELAASDLEEAELSGELACSFSTGDTLPLLFAMGVVASEEPAQGVVKVSGYVERVGAPGGFDGIQDGATFTGQGKTIRIAITASASGEGESPFRSATLTYERADGKAPGTAI